MIASGWQGYVDILFTDDLGMTPQDRVALRLAYGWTPAPDYAVPRWYVLGVDPDGA